MVISLPQLVGEGQPWAEEDFAVQAHFEGHLGLGRSGLRMRC